jgi:hypothetical protein
MAIMRRVDDKAVERKIERVYDLINSSPVRSDRAVSDLEQSVMNDIAGLEHAVRQGDGSKIDQSVDRIIELAEKRNQMLRRI